MNRYVHQIPFAAQGAFVWNRPTVHNGKPVKSGDPVNNDAFTSVRLRQMYDARMIIPAPGFADSPKPAYLENGRGKADVLARELAKEESSAGEAVNAQRAQPRSAAKPTAPQRPAPKKPAPVAPSRAGKATAKPNPNSKSKPAKRAAR